MIGSPNQDDVSLPNYAEDIATADYVFGSFHLILLIVVIIFLIASKLRKHRLSSTQWILLINLIFVELVSVTIMFNYFGYGDDTKKNCLYWDHVFWGAADILLFNMQIMMGYKIYTVTNNMYEFAVKGNLPSLLSKRRDQAIHNAIWFVSIADIVVYTFLNTYWTYINRNMEVLALFNFGNRVMQIALNAANSLLFFGSCLLIRKVLAYTKVDRRQKNLLRLRYILITIGIVSAILTGLMVWGLYTQGFYNTLALLNYVF